jgi:hypothetical protein
MYEKIRETRKHRSTVIFTCDGILINGRNITIPDPSIDDSCSRVPRLYQYRMAI